MTPSNDLVKRLRDWAANTLGESARVLTEAADALERQQRELEAARTALKQIQKFCEGGVRATGHIFALAEAVLANRGKEGT